MKISDFFINKKTNNIKEHSFRLDLILLISIFYIIIEHPLPEIFPFSSFAVLVNRGIKMIIAAACAFLIFFFKLYKIRNIRIFAYFIAVLGVSGILNGKSIRSIALDSCLRNYIELLFCMSSFYIIKEKKKLFSWLAHASSFCLTLLVLTVIINATSFLLGHRLIDKDSMGSFYEFRLTAFSNPNVFGIFCGVLILLCLYCLLFSVYKSRLYNRILAIVGTFIGITGLGMTACRTAILGVSVGITLICFYYIRNILYRKITKKIIAGSLSIGLAIIIAIVSFLSFFAVIPVYKASIRLFASDDTAERTVSSIETRDVKGYEGSDVSTGRIDIWKSVIKSSASSAKRVLFGSSSIDIDTIVLDGTQDNVFYHSHNLFVEIFRLFGIVGLIIVILMMLRLVILAINTIFDSNSEPICLFSSVYILSILVMGMTEVIPIPSTVYHLGGMTFFACAALLETFYNRKTFDHK